MKFFEEIARALCVGRVTADQLAARRKSRDRERSNVLRESIRRGPRPGGARSPDTRQRQPVVLALPRGGVPVAAEVAAALGAPLDLILVRKIGVPAQPELAMGAVADGAAPIVVRNAEIIQHSGVTEAEFNAVRDAELAEIERRRRRYLGARAREAVAGRIVIVIDDGIATGATMRTALRAVRAARAGRAGARRAGGGQGHTR